MGRAESAKEITFGTNDERMIAITGCPNSNAVTVFLRGGNKMIVEEAKRALHDAMCVVRNLIVDNRVVPGGGASELSCAIAVERKMDQLASSLQYAYKGFAKALESIPMALAENLGYAPIDHVYSIKAQQIKQSNHNLGICVDDDCALGYADLLKNYVVEGFFSKKQQILLATQVVRMILKIDDVRDIDDGGGLGE
ncbi:hypothetical protein ACOME3_009514 [Neoechinorhynchus agilis]